MDIGGNNLGNLQSPEADPIYPHGFFRAIRLDWGMDEQMKTLLVDGSWKRETKIAEMG